MEMDDGRVTEAAAAAFAWASASAAILASVSAVVRASASAAGSGVGVGVAGVGFFAGTFTGAFMTGFVGACASAGVVQNRAAATRVGKALIGKDLPRSPLHWS